MPLQKWTLIDPARNTRLDHLDITPVEVGGEPGSFSVQARTLRSGLSDGVLSVRLETGSCVVEILPTRGMGIWKAWYRGEEIGWKSPVRGPVHPSFVPLMEPSGLGWLDGFDELLVRCGLESNGAPEFDAEGRLKYPLHGRIANRPAHFAEISLDVEKGQLALHGEVEETRFHFHKLRLRTSIVMTIGQSRVHVHDEIVNLSGSPAAAQMLYHINFGHPLLDAGSRLVAPIRQVVPRNAHSALGIATWDSFAAEEPGFAEQVYFLQLAGDASDQTQVLLKNAHGTRGVGLHFNNRQLPWFTLWKNTTSLADGFVTGLEPGTNFPNPRTFEGQHGRVVSLAPGASATFDLHFQPLGSTAQVEAAEQAVRQLQGSTSPTIHKQPLPDWCAP
ncbi:MAG: aldose 1-epimerase family protein [Pirellulaceae bacterium]